MPIAEAHDGGGMIGLLVVVRVLPEWLPRRAIDRHQATVERADDDVRLSVVIEVEDRWRRDHALLGARRHEAFDLGGKCAVDERSERRAVLRARQRLAAGPEDHPRRAV